MESKRTEAPNADRPIDAEHDDELAPTRTEPTAEHAQPVADEPIPVRESATEPADEPERVGSEVIPDRSDADSATAGSRPSGGSTAMAPGAASATMGPSADSVRPGSGSAVAGSRPDADSSTAEPVAARTGTEDELDGRTGTGDELGARTGSGDRLGGRSGSGDELAALLSPADVDKYLDDWRTVQASFVDDPSAATGRAEALVGQLIDTLTARIGERRAALSAQRTSTEGERTEQLRLALRGYRALLQQLLPARQ
jgi:hypothetical protein